METREALVMLGIDTPEQHGIGLMSLAMPYPVETKAIETFAQDYQEILVVEEKRGLVPVNRTDLNQSSQTTQAGGKRC